MGDQVLENYKPIANEGSYSNFKIFLTEGPSFDLSFGRLDGDGCYQESHDEA